MATYGEVTVRELLDDSALRHEVAELLAMTERELLRALNREEDDSALSDFFTPIPADLENCNVADVRDDGDSAARIAAHTGLSRAKVAGILRSTHGRTLLENAFDFVWPERPRQEAPSQRQGKSDVRPPRRPHETNSHTSSGVLDVTPSEYARATRPSIFVSYSRKDRRYVDALHVHLRPLERDSAVELWDDSKIKTGAKWRDEIQVAIHRAFAAVLIVSADFLASDFIHAEEIPPLLIAAQRRGAVIMPLIVGHCLFERHPVLSQFNAFNSPSRPLADVTKNQRDKILAKLANELASLVRGAVENSK